VKVGQTWSIANLGICKESALHLPEIKKSIESMEIKYMQYKAEMWKPPGDKYPNSISYKGMWYPFIFYDDSNTWKDNNSGKDVRQKLNIFNGSFNGKEYVLGKQIYNPMNVEHIIKWLDEILSTTKITTQVVAPRNLNSLVAKSNSEPNDKDYKINTKLNIVPRKKYGK